VEHGLLQAAFDDVIVERRSGLTQEERRGLEVLSADFRLS
jgi:hypothetical protein